MMLRRELLLLAAAVLAALAGVATAGQSAPAAAAMGVAPAAPAAAAGEAPARSAGPAARYAARHSEAGIAVELEILAAGPPAAGRPAATPAAAPTDHELREGEPVVFRFRIADTANGMPFGGAYPAAWVGRLGGVPGPAAPPAASAASPGGGASGAVPPADPSCRQSVESFVAGGLFARAELDLNVYYALTLNDDATLSVIDPLFGFGGTNLLAMVSLESPGDDWALSPDRSSLYVSQPDAGKVAVVDTASFRVVAQLATGGRPGRLAMTADGSRLWVGLDPSPAGAAAAGAGAVSGVAVLDTGRREVLARLPIGAGRHDIALAEDGRYAFVTAGEARAVTVVDGVRLQTIGSVALGASPAGVAYSPLAHAAYASSEADGKIVAVAIAGDGRPVKVAEIAAASGIGSVRFAPGGRLGFVVNPPHDRVHIFDTATNRLVQTVAAGKQPDQVAFSSTLAYIRHRGTDTVLMVPLGQVGTSGAPVPVADFTGGQHPPGLMSRPTPALSIVQAPGDAAVLVANPADHMVYYYKEGMAAPMGSFPAIDREPRAVLVLDRSLHERAPGSYETVARLPLPGRYQVAFFLDAPRIVECFPIEVVPDPALAAEHRRKRPLAVEPLGVVRTVEVAKPVHFRFRLRDPEDDAVVDGLRDVEVLYFLSPGIWSARLPGRPEGAGIYEADLVPPQAGIYFVAVACPSRHLSFDRSPQTVLEAFSAAPSTAPLAMPAASDRPAPASSAPPSVTPPGAIPGDDAAPPWRRKPAGRATG